MTLVIGLRCSDGVVIGADRMDIKIRATSIKSYVTKLHEFQFGDGRALIIGSAGSKQDARRAIASINPERYNLREATSLDEYLEQVVEPQLSRFYSRLREARGSEPNFSLTIGCINPDGKPGIATVYPDGSFDLENISTMGVGAPFAELILRDVDVGQLDADTAVYLVGVIIAKVSLVHAQVNGVTGGMDVFEVTSREPKIVKKISIEEFIKILELQRALSFKDYLNKLKDVLKKIET